MVKRFVTVVLLCVVVSLCLFAGETTVKGGSSLAGAMLIRNGNADPVVSYAFSPYLNVVYTAQGSFRSELKASADVVNVNDLVRSSSFSLDKAYVRFRIPTFGNLKLTTMAGKAPVSWGIGQLYRGGDILFEKPLSNSEAGVDVENTIWVLSLSQSLGNGLSVELAFVPAVEDIPNERFGVLVRKSLSSAVSDYIKETRAAYVYEPKASDRHRASVLMDANLLVDLNVCVESRFRSAKDIRLVANAMRAFPIDTELSNHTLTAYVSYQGDFYEGSHDLCEYVSFDATERLSIAIVQSNSWKAGSYTFGCTLSSSLAVADGVDASVAANVSKAKDMDPSFTVGGGLQYSF